MIRTIKRCVIIGIVTLLIGLLSVLLHISLSPWMFRLLDEETGEEDAVALHIAFWKEHQELKEQIEEYVEAGIMTREQADKMFAPPERPKDPAERVRRQLEGAVASGRATQEEADRTFRLWQMTKKIQEEQAQKPFVFRGLLNQREQFIAEHEALAEIVDIPPLPSLPYRPRMQAINAIVDSRGYDREELYEYYKPVMKQIERLTERRLRRAKQTWEFLSLFDDGETEELEQRINGRLEKNPHDIPALLMRLSLYRSKIMPDAAFDVVEHIVDAMENFNPNGLDKRAVLYHALRSVSVYLSMTDEHVENARERSTGKISMGCMEILYMLENAGDW